METMHFHIAHTKGFLGQLRFAFRGVPINNLAPIKNCSGVQGNLIWMPGIGKGGIKLIIPPLPTLAQNISLCARSTLMLVVKNSCHVCPPPCKIIHSLNIVDYLHVQADNPWYNYT